MARTRISLTGALVLASLVALSLAGSTGAAAAAPSPAAVVDDPLKRAECPVEVPSEHADRVTCHVLVVPERRTDEADPEKTLRLPVAVIESRAAEAAADPLVFPTSGGPGGGTLDSLWYFLDYADWVGDRDIILIEQRGDALAGPTLNCPELDTAHLIVDGVLLTGSEAAARRAEQVRACHERLTAEGIDLGAYTSAESVTDLADLRAALEYDMWNLYGVSYGSRLAMTVMRDRPEGLRSVILDGAYPPNVNWFESLPTGFMSALDALLGACAAAADCEEVYPELEQSLESLLDSAAQTPIPVVVDSPADGSPVRLDIGDTELTGGLFDALYDPNVVRVLPFLIDQLARGNTDSVLPLAQRSVDFRDRFTEGLELSVDCAEEAPFNDDARIAEAMAADPILEHFAVRETFREDCATWAVPPLSEIENQAVASSIPTLIMTGGYDPVTPLAFAEAAAEQLSAHHLFEFPTMSHGSVWQNWVDGCPASIAEQFLRDPSVPPVSSCIAAMPPTDFLTTEDIHPTTAFYRLNSDVLEGREPIQIGIAVLTIAVLAGTLVYGLVYGIAWLIRRRGAAPAATVLVAATASALYLAFAAALAQVMLNTDPLILAFGIPPAALALSLIPIVAVAVTILLTIVVVRAWIGGDGALLHRVLLSVSTAASILFAAWLIARGLLIL